MVDPKKLLKQLKSYERFKLLTKAIQMVALSQLSGLKTKIASRQYALSSILPYFDTSSYSDKDLNYLVLSITVDKSCCGPHNGNVLKASKSLIEDLKEKNKNIKLASIGRKAKFFFKKYYRAFQVLNRAPKFREQLSIHPKIWKRLSEEIQNKIKKVRDSVREEGRSEQPKNSPPKAIPPQYNLNKSTNNTTKEIDGAERLTAMIQSYELANETFSDSFDSDEEDARMGAMVHRVGENINVQANIECERRFPCAKHSSRSSYAICDSAADSCIIGKMAKVEMVTNRTANLSGYDPETTRSPKLPIVTALIKTLTKENIPILL